MLEFEFTNLLTTPDCWNINDSSCKLQLVIYKYYK